MGGRRTEYHPGTLDAIDLPVGTQGLELHEWVQAPYFAFVTSAIPFVTPVYEYRNPSHSNY
jgi:hypothetical protein